MLTVACTLSMYILNNLLSFTSKARYGKTFPKTEQLILFITLSLVAALVQPIHWQWQ